MKRILQLIVLFTLLFTLTACSQAENTSPATQEEPQASAQAGGRILIAYFTVPETDGVDTVSSASRVAVDGQVMGNTQYVARIIQEITGGGLRRIETVQTYPGTHEPLLDFVHQEMMAGARPELAGHIDNLSDYDAVFLGYPNWNADLPMPLYTFLESHDLNGKTIIPFNTHGGSQLSGTIETIARLQPVAEVIQDGFTVFRNSVASSREDIIAWLAGLGYEGD